MRLDTFAISLLICITILVAGVLIINDQKLKYESFDVDNSTFANVTKNIDKLYNHTEQMKQALEKPVNILNVWEYLLTGGYNALRIIWDILTIPADLAVQFARLIDLPKEIRIVALISLVILIVFSLIYMWFRFQPR